MRSLFLLAASLAIPIAMPGQDYPHHNFRAGLGAGVPGADLRPFFDPKFGFTVGYGYRFHRYFQADIGLDTVVGAAGVRDFAETPLGYRRIRDFQYLVPMGGRVILPLAQGRFQFFAGGGGTYMRYSERISQPNSYYQIDCPFCTSRGGWGYYATAGFQVALDRYQHFRFGMGPRVYRGHTDGEPLGAVPGVRTRDQWINLMAEFGFSF
ncbi:MAG: outer membrane beta-barrel protein [Bryobacterales bacterium]|nr:outer membrane beta-barrel protein [Bryobacterales bacterium]